MARPCDRIRDRLIVDRGAALDGDATVRAHLDHCAACAAFAERLAAVRGGLRDHHARALPDPAFATRVVAGLDDRSPVDLMGRAAWRLLPATVALAAVLVWAAVDSGAPTSVAGGSASGGDATIGAPATTGESDAAPSDDPLAWVLELTGESS